MRAARTEQVIGVAAEQVFHVLSQYVHTYSNIISFHIVYLIRNKHRNPAKSVELLKIMDKHPEHPIPKSNHSRIITSAVRRTLDGRLIRRRPEHPDRDCVLCRCYPSCRNRRSNADAVFRVDEDHSDVAGMV